MNRFQGRHDGFTLIELIGVLAVMAILASFIVPNLIGRLDSAARDAEAQNLQTSGQGVELFVRQSRTLPPNLAALSPDYVPFGIAQLTTNPRNWPRYLVVHPGLAGFANGVGLAAASLGNARVLVISSLVADAAPVITTAAQFDTWWNTNDSLNVDLKIYRGNLGGLFRQVAVNAVGAGGSYQVDSTQTNSGGGALPAHGAYHLIGTTVGLDEAGTYAVPEVLLTLTADSGYNFDAARPVGSKWQKN